MKVRFYRKLLFFFGIKDLTDEIDLDFNYSVRATFEGGFILLLYILNQYFLDIFINNVNIFSRGILLIILLVTFVETLYILTIRKYYNYKK